MPRYRSRQIETESVNQRLLRRGAVTRQHISRWAVGATELAPGVVGDIHLHPTTIERIREIANGIGAGQLLIVEVDGQSFADGETYIDADSIVYQQGFVDVLAAGDSIIWPMEAVGEVQVEFVWDTYEGGGTIEIEVDGEVPAFGLLAEGDSGQRGVTRRGVHITEGAVVKIKVTQESGSAQTGSAFVEFSIADPTFDPAIGVVEPPPLEVITDGFDFGWPVGEPTAESIDGRITETGGKTWTNDDGSTIAIFSPSQAQGIGTMPVDGLPEATVPAGFSDGEILVRVTPIQETNVPAFRNGMVFRYVDHDNFWLWYQLLSPVSGLFYALLCYEAGVIVYDSGQLTTGARGTGSVISMLVVLDGPDIEAWYDGVLRVSVTNATHQAATRHGIFTFGYGVDYFSAVPP